MRNPSGLADTARSLPLAANSRQILHFVDLGVLVFRCRATGACVSNGINADRRSFFQMQHCKMAASTAAGGLTSSTLQIANYRDLGSLSAKRRSHFYPGRMRHSRSLNGTDAKLLWEAMS